jgi:hypothetical protein
MQPFIKIARGLSSPAVLIAAVWWATLIGVAVGPVDYPRQSSAALLALVAADVFVIGDRESSRRGAML